MTYPFDVDLEAVESVIGACADALLVELDSLLLEAILHGRLSSRAIVGCTIVLDPSLHVINIVVSAEDLIFWQLSHTADQVFITSIEGDHTSWEDVIVLDVVIKTGLLTFGKLFFIIINCRTIFVVFDHLLHERVLSALEFTREAVKDVTTVTAVVFT